MKQDKHIHVRIDTSHGLRPFEEGEGEAECEDTGHESASRTSDADWDLRLESSARLRGPSDRFRALAVSPSPLKIHGPDSNDKSESQALILHHHRLNASRHPKITCP
jgi:hypothetical protein